MKIKRIVLHPVFFAVTGLIICFTGLLFMLKSCNDDVKEGLAIYEKERAEMKQCIGEKVIIDKDTFTITNYKVLDAEFTLNNGAVISKYFAMKRMLNDSIVLN